MKRHHVGHHRKYKSRCGVHEGRLPLFPKGLLNAALDVWSAKNGYGLSPIAQSRSSIAYWPKSKIA